MKISRARGATIAGGLLLLAGTGLLLRAIPFWRALTSTTWRVIVPLVGLSLGIAKGVFILRRTAARMISRMETLPEPFWIWQTYPAYFYPLLGLMIAAGVTVRVRYGASAPGAVAGLYFGIGSALLSSCGTYFRAARAKAPAAAAARQS